MLARLVKVFDRIIDMFFALACAILGLVLLIITVEIVSRYFLNLPQIWELEFTEFGLLFITFLGAAYVLKMDRHVAVDIMLVWLGPKNRSLVNMITSILTAVVWLVILLYAVDTTVEQSRMGTRTLTALQLPKYPFVAVIAVGSFLLFIQSLRRTCGCWASWKALRIRE